MCHLGGADGPITRPTCAATIASEPSWCGCGANRGLLTTPGREQEWNLSVAHDEAGVDRYLEAVAELSGRLSGTVRA